MRVLPGKQPQWPRLPILNVGGRQPNTSATPPPRPAATLRITCTGCPLRRWSTWAAWFRLSHDQAVDKHFIPAIETSTNGGGQQILICKLAPAKGSAHRRHCASYRAHRVSIFLQAHHQSHWWGPRLWLPVYVQSLRRLLAPPQPPTNGRAIQRRPGIPCLQVGGTRGRGPPLPGPVSAPVQCS